MIDNLELIKPLLNFEMDVSKYINLGDFQSKIEVSSPTYGNYYGTEVLIVDMISATNDGHLKEIYNLYDKIYDKLLKGIRTIVKLENKKFGDTALYKFKVYLPFVEDNLNWRIDKKGLKGDNLPIAVKKSTFLKSLTKMLKNDR